MVRHNHPGQQAIPLQMAETESVFHQRSDVRPTQMAAASTSIQIVLNLQPAFVVVLNLKYGFPFGTQCRWKGIGQMKSHKLYEAGLVAVRQVTAFIPTAKTAFRIFTAQRF